MNYKITGTGSCIPETIKKNSEFLSNYFFDIDGNQIQSSNIDIAKNVHHTEKTSKSHGFS